MMLNLDISAKREFVKLTHYTLQSGSPYSHRAGTREANEDKRQVLKVTSPDFVIRAIHMGP